MEKNVSLKAVRFGPFEADLRAGELRKHGVKLKLVGQPFEVLAMLLESPGQLVTREELRTRLWPGDTFVDFDHGLNTAVNKLREALGDAAANPRFVQTVARRGYRFIAPVQQNGAAPLAAREGMLRTESAAAADKPNDSTVQALHPELEVPVPR